MISPRNRSLQAHFASFFTACRKDSASHPSPCLFYKFEKWNFRGKRPLFLPELTVLDPADKIIKSSCVEIDKGERRGRGRFRAHSSHSLCQEDLDRRTVFAMTEKRLSLFKPPSHSSRGLLAYRSILFLFPFSYWALSSCSVSSSLSPAFFLALRNPWRKTRSGDVSWFSGFELTG